ncbi:30S ribosomal protein S17e [Candidatus Woesearchaeota archaeon]|nr:30S ribosomal protein S17e [Candidatus Woesearchaeota archaeon]
MGRVKTMMIKRSANKLLKEYKSSFNSDFNYNKNQVVKFADIRSKKIKNVLAGYITRLIKRGVQSNKL